MAEVYAFLADGFELVECLAVVDVLRRGRVDIQTVSITGNRVVTCSHGVPVTADKLWEEIDASDAKMLFLPGGKKGTDSLAVFKPLIDALKKAAADPDRRVAAICAAPSVLGQNGLLVGRECTCYPGFEDKLIEAEYVPHKGVVTDGNITTARGMGVSTDMGLELLALLRDRALSDTIKAQIQHPDTL
ncbi:MAG: DJ-1/PfpI family protein [Lachnospiraceae bacterium]|nr:DJ-1/PfpI family protein [Lachnospiraceae bacterium]